jgi:hypothetical protein
MTRTSPTLRLATLLSATVDRSKRYSLSDVGPTERPKDGVTGEQAAFFDLYDDKGAIYRVNVSRYA